MRKPRAHSGKESIFRRVHKERLKYISVLPSLITILNGVCGFAAINFAGKGAVSGNSGFTYHNLDVAYFAMSGYMILLAMVFDMLDGRVARMSQNTSSFGGQLDSLCDVISFGVAPAYLMLKVLESKLGSYTALNPMIANYLTRFLWLLATVYVCCAVIRLARFNVENLEDESAHMSFVGLPSPAAAGVVASLVIFRQDILPEVGKESAQAHLVLENVVVYMLPLMLLASALLMVSRVRYPHVVNQYLRGKKPFAQLIWMVVALGLVFGTTFQIALMAAFCGFAATGFLKSLYHKMIRRSVELPVPAEHPASTA
jgi:CDP-diacylglycerol---serine O-phosphatidyltransferase